MVLQPETSKPKPESDDSTDKEYLVIWLQCSGCCGCSISLLNAVDQSVEELVTGEINLNAHISLDYHATLMINEGSEVIKNLYNRAEDENRKYILVIEGAIPAGESELCGTIGEEGGEPISMASLVRSLAPNALGVIAVGTCASFGGISAAEPNPSGCLSAERFLQSAEMAVPLINIPGCPPHPDWMLNAIKGILQHGWPDKEDLDDYNRPKAIYAAVIHESCQRRQYCDEEKFAQTFGEIGCLEKLGCKGPITYAECPNLGWNNNVNWCNLSGGPCLACVEPTFPDAVSPFYKRTAEEATMEIMRLRRKKLREKRLS